MSIILLEDKENPDKQSIDEKTRVDVSLSSLDIEASEEGSLIKTNFISSGLTIYIDPEMDSDATVYYTPIYAEKLSYSTWLARINKNFEELD
jgi:hypothetical protein